MKIKGADNQGHFRRGNVTFGHYGGCTTSSWACAHPREISSHSVVMLLLQRKKRGKNGACAEPTSGQGHFRTCPLPVTWVCHFRIWRNFRLRMRRTYFRTRHVIDVTSGHMTDVTSGHVTNVTSGHVTNVISGHVTSPPHSTPSNANLSVPIYYSDYMTIVILTWRLLFLHDDCYSYMTIVILTWRLLFLHDDCYSYMTTVIPDYMMTVIPEARRLHLDIPILLISIDQHCRGGFNLFNPTQSILNNLGIGRFAHLSGEGMSYFYVPWIHPGFYDSLIQNQITAFLY